MLSTAKLVAALAAAVLVACGGPRGGWRPPPPEPAAKVVVVVVVDQLSDEAFERKLAIAEHGFAELLRRGNRYRARAPHAATTTAAGHATLSTGTPPVQHGIIGNEWWDRDLGREIKATEDPAGGVSAAHLKMPGIADALTGRRNGARAIGIAIKDRSAILGLGHSGEPVWFDSSVPAMVGLGGAPAWLGPLADPAAIRARLATTWTPLLPADQLVRLSGGPDDAAGELAIPGWTARFPHALAAAVKPTTALATSPAGNRLVIDAALAALGDLDLDDGVADYLLVSLSAHDYIVHAFGPDSWEAWDAFARLDRDLADLIAALDARAGRDGWAIVLTSDHGGPSSPERRRAAGLPGVRLTFDDVRAVAERAAETAAGQPGPWIASTRPPYVYLNARAAALPDDVRGHVLDAIDVAVGNLPGIYTAWRTTGLQGTCATRDLEWEVMCVSVHPGRSGEIFYVPDEGTSVVNPAYPDTVTHGSAHFYDRDVPLIIVEPGARGGRDASERPISALLVRPTILRILGGPSALTEPGLPRWE